MLVFHKNYTLMPIKLIECPRDAMQGLHQFIPTDIKVNYLNQLLQVGFDTLDFGSFVSPKAIPQLQDTAEVLARLDMASVRTKLLAIVANKRGAEAACLHPEITYLGFPFSVSETFQKRNTNSSIQESLQTVAEIQELCIRNGKKLVIYISMGFGNPYGDLWTAEIVAHWVQKIVAMDIQIISLSDTIGIAKPADISYIFTALIKELPQVEFGAHLHTTPTTWEEKITAAYQSGCLRFDGAIKGFGGCPMATDALTGNMATENIVAFFDQKEIEMNLNRKAFALSLDQANFVFSQS